MTYILITGANRGLGLALVELCLARGDHIFAGCRNPDQADA
jgi:NAD(P)-dependent dehydrogenase (short-subunit alcohol dehydrogenase family)